MNKKEKFFTFIGMLQGTAVTLLIVLFLCGVFDVQIDHIVQWFIKFILGLF